MSEGTTLVGAVALVTGATGGLGAEICRQLVRCGCRVVLAVRDVESAGALLEELRAAGGQAEACALDLEDEGSVLEAAAEARRRYPALNLLCNCAGRFEPQPQSSLEALRWSTAEQQLRIHAIGPLVLTTALLPALRAAPWGHVVNVTSDCASLDSMDGSHTLYRMSKAAMVAWTVNLAAGLHDAAIRVSALDPGWMRTAMGGPRAPLDPVMVAEELVRFVEYCTRASPEVSIWSGAKQPVAWTPAINGRERD